MFNISYKYKFTYKFMAYLSKTPTQMIYLESHMILQGCNEINKTALGQDKQGLVLSPLSSPPTKISYIMRKNSFFKHIYR